MPVSGIHRRPLTPALVEKARTALFHNLGRAYRTFNFDTVAEEILRPLMRETEAEYGALVITHPSPSEPLLVLRRGFTEDPKRNEVLGYHRRELEKMGREMISRILDYSSAEQRAHAPLVGDKSLTARVALPMNLIYEQRGILMLASAQEPIPPLLGDAGLLLLEDLAQEYAFALKNSIYVTRMEELTTKDDLTLSFNRRYFEEYMRDELSRARRYSKPLTLIFMDLDGLREINNRYGHALGSRSLQECAARVLTAVRNIDKVFRYGGDEFCVLLPETDWRGAMEVAERLKERIASRPFLVDETGGIALTASFGLASFPEHAQSLEELVKAADEAMYEIKRSGKNDINVAGGALNAKPPAATDDKTENH
jgi:diguanylate cyclase (GGDEF)-like protein